MPSGPLTEPVFRKEPTTLGRLAESNQLLRYLDAVEEMGTGALQQSRSDAFPPVRLRRPYAGYSKQRKALRCFRQD